jgi:hypothetical protein
MVKTPDVDFEYLADHASTKSVNSLTTGENVGLFLVDLTVLLLPESNFETALMLIILFESMF